MSTLPLSQTQRYFLDVLVEDGFDPTWQHVATAFAFPAELDPARAVEIASRLAERYPILATHLTYEDGEPLQAQGVHGELPCTVMDLRGRSDEEVDLTLSRWADQPFDVGSGPLWRFAFALATGRTVFALVCHHLISDAASVWLLAKDCILAYFERELDPAGRPFADFVSEERDLLAGPEVARRLEYWTKHLDGAVPTILTESRPGPHELSSSYPIPVGFGEDAGDALQAEARARRVTPLPLLAANVLTAVKRASGQDDVLLGVVTDLRGQRFTTTVGPFTDVMLVRDPHPEGEDETRRLSSIRNAFFIGWQQHLPVAFLRERLPHLRAGGVDAVKNPCDVFLNFLPAPVASDWQFIAAVCGDLAPSLYFPRQRLSAPSRRFHAPLYIFLFSLIERLDGWIYAHGRPELAALNAAVAQELRLSISGTTVPA